MTIQVKGLEEVKQLLTTTADVQSYNALLIKVATLIKDNIKTKTAAGFDYLNRGFQPYTEVYKKFKIKKGHSGKVNLRLSGQMMDNLQVLQRDGNVSVGFSDGSAEQRATYNQEGKVPRVFMDIGPDVDAQINKTIDDFVNKLMGI